MYIVVSTTPASGGVGVSICRSQPLRQHVRSPPV